MRRYCLSCGRPGVIGFFCRRCAERHAVLGWLRFLIPGSKP